MDLDSVNQSFSTQKKPMGAMVRGTHCEMFARTQTFQTSGLAWGIPCVLPVLLGNSAGFARKRRNPPRINQSQLGFVKFDMIPRG